VGAALGVAGNVAHSGHAELAQTIRNAASSAFFDGFHTANYLACGVAAAGALMALVLLPAHPRAAEADDAPSASELVAPGAARA
jgi:hypothetical protein